MCKVKLNEKHTQRKQWPDAIVKHHIQYEQHCPIWTHDVYIHPQATGSGDGSSRSPWSHSVWSSEETSVNRWSQSQPTSSCKHHTSFREKENTVHFNQQWRFCPHSLTLPSTNTNWDFLTNLYASYFHTVWLIGLLLACLSSSKIIEKSRFYDSCNFSLLQTHKSYAHLYGAFFIFWLIILVLNNLIVYKIERVLLNIFDI